jgi:hypothetical protein
MSAALHATGEMAQRFEAPLSISLFSAITPGFQHIFCLSLGVQQKVMLERG